MQLSLSSVVRAPCFAPRSTVSRNRWASVVKPQAIAARDERDEDDDAAGVLSGEWAPTWSLGLANARPARGATTARSTVVARGTASEEGAADPSGILSGEWAPEHEWAMACYDDVRRIYSERKKKRAQLNGAR